MSLDLFLFLIVPFFIYGKLTSAFENSKTTLMVIGAIWLIAFSSKYFEVDTIFLEIYAFLMFLFVRAVFREKFQNTKNRWIRRILYA